MPISQTTAWVYALGGALRAMITSAILVYWNSFILERTEVTPHQLGFMMIIIKLFDAMTDPVVGTVSDSIVYPGGRRRIQILLATVPLSLSYISLWIIPYDHTLPHYIYYVLVSCIFDVFLSIFEINYDSLVSEMTMLYEERVPLIHKKWLVFALFAMATTVTQAWYISEHPNSTSFARAAIAVVVIGSPLAIACAYKCRERSGGAAGGGIVLIHMTPLSKPGLSASSSNGSLDIHEPSPSASVVVDDLLDPLPASPPKPFFRQMWYDYSAVFANKNYMILAVVNMGVSIVINILMTMLLLYVKHVLFKDDAAMVQILLRVQSGIVVGLNVFAALFYFKVIVDKKKTLMGVLATMTVSFIIFSILKHSDVIEILLGACVSGSTIMLQAMIPDTIDIGSITNRNGGENVGSRQEGCYYGFFSVIAKLAAAIAIPMVNFTLGWVGFIADEQSRDVSDYIHLLFSVIPPCLLALSMAALFFYDITPENHAISMHATRIQSTLINESEDF